MKNQHESSKQHGLNLEAGLSVVWYMSSSGKTPDEEWTVVSYDDGSFWLFDNASAEKITSIGELDEGEKTEIYLTKNAAVISISETCALSFPDLQSWVGAILRKAKNEN